MIGRPFRCDLHCLPMAENVAVVVIVVPHEQVAGVSIVVEVVGEMPHLLFEVIAVVYDFSCDREAAPTEWEETLPRCRTLRRSSPRNVRVLRSPSR